MLTFLNLIDDLLVSLLDKTGKKWKTLTGLIALAVGFAAHSFLPEGQEQLATFADWLMVFGAGLAGVGTIHAAKSSQAARK